ncbi:hypothetical protein CB1_000780002 [Camelus ferus]|nr:hypothetical protein CB1_000780002 [Camelus ferus]
MLRSVSPRVEDGCGPFWTVAPAVASYTDASSALHWTVFHQRLGDAAASSSGEPRQAEESDVCDGRVQCARPWQEQKPRALGSASQCHEVAPVTTANGERSVGLTPLSQCLPPGRCGHSPTSGIRTSSLEEARNTQALLREVPPRLLLPLQRRKRSYPQAGGECSLMLLRQSEHLLGANGT